MMLSTVFGYIQNRNSEDISAVIYLDVPSRWIWSDRNKTIDSYVDEFYC